MERISALGYVKILRAVMESFNDVVGDMDQLDYNYEGKESEIARRLRNNIDTLLPVQS
jgi:hypothetical protein